MQTVIPRSPLGPRLSREGVAQPGAAENCASDGTNCASDGTENDAGATSNRARTYGFGLRPGPFATDSTRVPPAPPTTRRDAAAAPYPDRAADRDRWILARRGPRPAHDLRQPHAAFVETERAANGEIVPVLTVLLTSRECPWRCLMCDLWQFTVEGNIPPGAIAGQLRAALATTAGATPRPRQLKLYNGGSFFDPRAIPPADYPAIAAQAVGFDRVIVECHPTLVGRRTLAFQDSLATQAAAANRVTPALEVAMGLETAHPGVLARLNKRLTLDGFRRAADFLREHGLALRVFILVKPPFLSEPEALEWACRSLDFAFDGGASVAVLIPPRPGNGALEALAAAGDFAPPKFATLEAALAYGVGLRRGRVFADLWDLERFADCPACFAARQERLVRTNHEQIVQAGPACPVCGSAQPAAL